MAQAQAQAQALGNECVMSKWASPGAGNLVKLDGWSASRRCVSFRGYRRRQMHLMVRAVDPKSTGGGGGGGGDRDGKKAAVPNSNYVVPLDNAASCITRPLAEILRDLNKRIPDNILKPHSNIIPWYHANRMLSFYAPGWCGEVRDVIFSDDGSVTVVYRVTIRGSDGEAYREATGTILSSDPKSADLVAAAEEIAFVRACARFGLGLYLYHE